MDSLAIAAIATGALGLGLEVERARLASALARIPRRVAVTGTRGKSSVTRLIAAGLRSGGLRAWGKVTGSAPVFIGPDGAESRIKRRGSATILEQSRLLREAAKGGAEAIVFEAMSVHPETQRVEGSRILKPTLLVLTNARLDHLAGAVATRGDVASMLLLSATPGCRVLVPEEEILPEIREACVRMGAELVPVPAPSSPTAKSTVTASAMPMASFEEGLGYPEFEVNLRLALAACGELGIGREAALMGMRACRPDVGSFRASRFELEPGRSVIAASAFAANDPESTMSVLRAAESSLEPSGRRVWLLNVRKDRGERTLQWVEELGGLAAKGELPFDELLVIGDGAHGRAAATLLRRRGIAAEYVSGSNASAITARAARGGESVFIFGMGNIAGIGRGLADYWASREAAS
jgi:poly-gamma-glutamate synthase PgsB/CapB